VRACIPATSWRGGGARDAGALAGLAAPRGRKRRDPQAERIARLEAEKHQLEQELAKTRFVVDVQAKLHAPLETLSESAEPEPGFFVKRCEFRGVDTRKCLSCKG
jgi:hypothetical protein